MTLIVCAKAQNEMVFASGSRGTFGDPQTLTAQNDTIKNVWLAICALLSKKYILLPLQGHEEVLKMRTHFNMLTMKRGSAEIVGAGLILIMLIFGSIGSYKILSENRYVGDVSVMKVYDLTKCDINSIPREDLKSFKSLKEADGYELAECGKR